MGRKKICLTFIRDRRKRHKLYQQRKLGLLKKAHELSVLCGIDIILSFSGVTPKKNWTLYSNQPSLSAHLSEFIHSENHLIDHPTPLMYPFINLKSLPLLAKRSPPSKGPVYILDQIDQDLTLDTLSLKIESSNPFSMAIERREPTTIFDRGIVLNQTFEDSEDYKREIDRGRESPPPSTAASESQPIPQDEENIQEAKPFQNNFLEFTGYIHKAIIQAPQKNLIPYGLIYTFFKAYFQISLQKNLKNRCLLKKIELIQKGKCLDLYIYIFDQLKRMVGKNQKDVQDNLHSNKNHWDDHSNSNKEVCPFYQENCVEKLSILSTSDGEYNLMTESDSEDDLGQIAETMIYLTPSLIRKGCIDRLPSFDRNLNQDQISLIELILNKIMIKTTPNTNNIPIQQEIELITKVPSVKLLYQNLKIEHHQLEQKIIQNIETNRNQSKINNNKLPSSYISSPFLRAPTKNNMKISTLLEDVSNHISSILEKMIDQK